MARHKIDYGIDLGTTNTVIARVDNGRARVLKGKKSQMDTTASCAACADIGTLLGGQEAFNIRVDETASSFMYFQKTGKVKPRNSAIEFKRTMGSSELYPFERMGRSFSSEELSAEILKRVRVNVLDETVSAVVITVPAMFKQPQIDATQRAAALAGFQHCEILQEPIAASIAYSVTGTATDGHWLVFDFGGGTFDVALLRSEEGITKVIDTNGDRRLGGKDLDASIVDLLFIPHLEEKFALAEALAKHEARAQLRAALLGTAEETKKEFSAESVVRIERENIGTDDDGKEIVLDITVTEEDFESVVIPHFQRAVDITLQLLGRNHLTGKDLSTVLLVGGPTLLPVARRLLQEQVCARVDFGVDPMTAVAEGAAIHASTRDVPKDLLTRDRTKIQLTVRYPETTVELEEPLGIRINRESQGSALPKHFRVEVARKDDMWASGQLLLEEDAGIITLPLVASRINMFSIRLLDEHGAKWDCEPNSLTILQGFRPAVATFPYDLCLFAFNAASGKEETIPFRGLGRNTTLPAKGFLEARTQIDLHPHKGGEILLPVYETQESGTRGYRAERQGTYKIPASKLPQFLPSDSLVEVVVNMDVSRRLEVKAYFPSFDEEIDAESAFIEDAADQAELADDLSRALAMVASLDQRSAPGGELDQHRKELNALRTELEQRGENGDTRLRVADRLTDTWKVLEKLSGSAAWPAAEEELRAALASASEAQETFGTDASAKSLKAAHADVAKIVESQDIAAATTLTRTLYSLRFTILQGQTGFWISILKRIDVSFGEIAWRSPGTARQILNEAKQHIAEGPTLRKLEDSVRKLWELQPDAEEAKARDVNRRLLRVQGAS